MAIKRFKNGDKLDSNSIAGLHMEFVHLFDNTVQPGDVGILCTEGSSYTVANDKFSNYDFLLIRCASRIWGWCKSVDYIPTGDLSGPSLGVGNLYSSVMPIHHSSTVASMQYYFTNDNTITVYYNSNPSGDNHMYINAIIGVKIA